MAAIRGIFAGSGFMSQGNPAVTRHPVTPEEAQAKLKQLGIDYANPRFEKICGGKYMAPLYNPATQQPEEAKACIDQFEFPDIPCVYPVVWVSAREAAEICEAMGKRLWTPTSGKARAPASRTARLSLGSRQRCEPQ